MHFWQRRSAVNTTDLQRAQNLIPGFLKKTLNADDKEWMTQFINTLRSQDGPASAEFAQEMAWVERTQEHLAQSTPQFDAQAGWQRMQGRLATPAANASAPKASAPAQPIWYKNPIVWLKDHLRTRADNALQWWQKPIIAATASAMLVGQMGLLAAVVRYMYTVEPQIAIVSPASGNKGTADSVVLAIVFKDKATLLEVRKLLDSVQGHVVGGPGAIGVWEVAVPKEKLGETIKALGAAKIVESVAPQ
jgi:hypothetical protein